MDVRHKLNGIFCEIFKDDALQIRPEMTANDVDGWDSFSHITLIVAIEARFNIKFMPRELLSLKNVGDIMNCVEKKIKV